MSIEPDNEPNHPSPTFTLTPADGDTVYIGQVLTLTAKIGNAPSIPSGATVTFTLSDGVKTLYDDASTVVKVETTDNKNGTATLDVQIINPAQAPEVKLATSVSAMPNFNPAHYTVHRAEISATSGPDKTYLPFPPDDTCTPADSKYTAKMTVTVVDIDNGNAPIPGFDVCWKESVGNSLFHDRTHPYADMTTKLTQAIDPFAPPDSTMHMVRTTTNSSGVATLYLVSRPGGVFTTFYNSVLAAANSYDPVTLGDLFAADPTNPTLHDVPKPEGISGGVLHYADVEGYDVLVHVSPYRDALDADKIFLFLNSVPYDSFLWAEGKDVYFNSKFPKAMGYSDTGPHANQDNILSFVVCRTDGYALTSGATRFPGTGPKGGNRPDPGVSRTLDQLSIENTENSITWQDVQQPMKVKIPLQQLNWKAAPNDKITMEIYLNAYKPGTDTHKPGIAPTPPATHTLSATEAAKDNYEFSVNQSFFADYDRMKDPPHSEGDFYAVYRVDLAAGGTKYSKPLKGLLDTTPPE